MNAYELADKLETDKWDEATIVLSIDAGIKMLRQQADRIAELKKCLIVEQEHNMMLEEKQSEPVAWMDKNDKTRIQTVQEWADDIPLYTTPQTKPLSDEEINQIIKQQDWFSMSWVDMVRRIEKIIYSKSSTIPNGLTDPKSYYQGYEDGKAQTKPLSDEEIAVIWANFGVPMTGIEFMKVARAIEQKVKGQ